MLLLSCSLIYWVDAQGPIEPVAVLFIGQENYSDVAERGYRYHVLMSGNMVVELGLYDFTKMFALVDDTAFGETDKATLLLQGCYEDQQELIKTNKVDLFFSHGHIAGDNMTFTGGNGVKDERGNPIAEFATPLESYLTFPQWEQELNEVRMLISQYYYKKTGLFSVPLNYDLDNFLEALLADQTLFGSQNETSYGTIEQMMEQFEIEGVLTISTTAHSAEEFFDEIAAQLGDFSCFDSLGVGIFIYGDTKPTDFKFSLMTSHNYPHSVIAPLVPGSDFTPTGVRSYRDHIIVTYDYLLERIEMAISDFGGSKAISSALASANAMFLRLKKRLETATLHYTPTTLIQALESQYVAESFYCQIDEPLNEEEVKRQWQILDALLQRFPELKPMSLEFSAISALLMAHSLVWGTQACFRSFSSEVFAAVEVETEEFELLFVPGDGALEQVAELGIEEYDEYTQIAVNYSISTNEFLLIFFKEAREHSKNPSDGVSIWAIVGGVLGAAALVAACAMGAVFWRRRRRNSDVTTPVVDAENATQTVI